MAWSSYFPWWPYHDHAILHNDHDMILPWSYRGEYESPWSNVGIEWSSSFTMAVNPGSSNVKFEDILSEESNRCPRFFEIKHQLTWCTFKDLILQFRVWIFVSKQTNSIFSWKTLIFMLHPCYPFVNWTEVFIRRLNLGNFQKSTSFFSQPGKKFSFRPRNLFGPWREHFLKENKIKIRNSSNGGN